MNRETKWKCTEQPKPWREATHSSQNLPESQVHFWGGTTWVGTLCIYSTECHSREVFLFRMLCGLSQRWTICEKASHSQPEEKQEKTKVQGSSLRLREKSTAEEGTRGLRVCGKESRKAALASAASQRGAMLAGVCPQKQQQKEARAIGLNLVLAPAQVRMFQ